MDKKQLASFRKLTIRIEKAVRATGRSASSMTDRDLRHVMIDAKIMNNDRKFLDEDGNVLTFV